MGLLCMRDTTIDPFKQSLASITLTAEQRILIEERYIRLLLESHTKCRTISGLYHTTRCITTIGSIIVPALLSIQYTNGAPFSAFTQYVYWTTWFISLLVTVSNGVLTLFKFDKKYYMMFVSYEQLKTEGWQFLALTGRYTGSEKDKTNNHDAQFRFFCKTIEKLWMRLMEEEYVKIQDVDKSTAAQNQCQGQIQGSIPSLVDINRTPEKDDMMTKLAALLTSSSAPRQQKPGVEIEEPLISSNDADNEKGSNNTKNTFTTITIE